MASTAIPAMLRLARRPSLEAAGGRGGTPVLTPPSGTVGGATSSNGRFWGSAGGAFMESCSGW
ncbi:hypothetical protein AB0C02_31570 [Micromonospora sp. NPDC048999]|uniref:hypothetical protein n=1 Tax=Micromonospora sp. NPDC048999 TaxID=3155391 RepID=UPI00340D48C7